MKDSKCDSNCGLEAQTFWTELNKAVIWGVTAVFVALSLLFFTDTNKAKKQGLRPVSHREFASFVKATGFVTDAERYGWSIVQKDVYSYVTVRGANWRKPDGTNEPASEDLPVTQVSYNDALAYCRWSKTRLPTYEEYWELAKNDTREVVSNNNAPLSSVTNVNLVGNVWELTSATRGNSVRLAGGSLFCSPDSCHGTQKDRLLMVDEETGNIHIGFAVLDSMETDNDDAAEP